MKFIQFIKKNQTQATIVGSMLFVITLSVFIFMNKSLRLDEAQSLFQTNGSFLGTIRLIASDIHLPIYFILLQIWQILFGTSLFAIRSLSLVFLLMALPAIYFLAKEAYSRNIALVAVTFSALSPFLNWFAAETRMYTLLFLITILNQLFFIKIWHREGQEISKKNIWIFYALTVFVGVYTHYFFAFVLIAQAAFYFLHRDIFPKGAFKRLASIATISLLMLGVWFLIRQTVGSSNSAPFLTAPTSVDVFNVFSNFFIGFQSNTINTFFLSLWPVSVLIGFTLLTKKYKVLPQTTFFLLSIFIPIILVFIISSTIRPLFLSRYLIIVMPSVYLIVIHYLSLYPLKVFKLIVGLLLIIFSFTLTLEAFSPKVPANENFRDVVTYVESQVKADDLFIVSAPFLTYPIEYYYHGNARLTTFPIWNRYEESKQIPPFSEQYLIDTVSTWSKSYSRLYILMGYDQGYEEKTRLYLDNNFERIEVKNFSPGLNLYVYKIRYI